MADIYELMLTVDLREDLSEEELAELRWHLGLGPQPETLRIVTEFPFTEVDDDGEFVVGDNPKPILGRQAGASTVEGALVSVLLLRQEPWRRGWALTSRQELHPDDFDRAGELLSWLATRVTDRHRSFDGAITLGTIRFYEEHRAEQLQVRDGEVVWPS